MTGCSHEGQYLIVPFDIVSDIIIKIIPCGLVMGNFGIHVAGDSETAGFGTAIPRLCVATIMTGRKPRITTDDVLAIFEENDDPCEPFSAPEIASNLSCHRNTARNKLEDLVFVGDLETKKVSASGRVYWRPGD